MPKKPRNDLSFKSKMIIAEMGMAGVSTGDLCFFADNANFFDREDGVSLEELAESYRLDTSSVWRRITRLIEIGVVVRLKRGRYGLADTLPDPQLNLAVMEYGALTG